MFSGEKASRLIASGGERLHGHVWKAVTEKGIGLLLIYYDKSVKIHSNVKYGDVRGYTGIN